MNPLLSRRALLGALGALAATSSTSVAVGQTYAGAPVISRELWDWVRAQLVLDPGLVWLDTAEFGPALRAVLVRAYRNLEAQSLDYRAESQDFEFNAPGTLAVLTAAGLHFGADPGELALTVGARAGLGLVALGLDLQPGDEVVASLHDHPAAVYPWLAQARRRGIRVVQIPDTAVPANPGAVLQNYAAALTPKTKALLLAHVRHTDGAVMPVREVCTLARGKGIFTIVDGTLAAGQVDFRLADLACDAYATGLDRWLNGPVDAGLLYVRRESQGRVWPAAPERADGWDANDRFGAALTGGVDGRLTAQVRFGGSPQSRAPALAAMPLAFEFHQAVSRPRIALRIRELAAHLRAALAGIRGVEIVTPSHAAMSAGIVSFRTATRDPEQLVAAMAAEDRIVAGHVRNGPGFNVMRISVHPANDPLDLDRCVAAVRRRL